MPDNIDASNKYISLANAAKQCDLTHDHLRRMAREGKLKAIKIGRDWLTTEEALRAYLVTDRQSGRKSKH